MVGKTRRLRDPIHGDILLDAIHAAVVDTRPFQRLRYIRQNGLLHFVFPGAVHTRFIHSIGTMAISCRVFDKLIPRAELTKRKQQQAHYYLRTAFSLAALLHDVGHCAFSHSIEQVTFREKPILGTMRELLEQWGESALLKEYEEIDTDAIDNPVTHEQIGLAIARRIFDSNNVSEACRKSKISSEALGRDVRAIMDGRLSPSEQLTKHTDALRDVLDPKNETATIDTELLSILHDLVSGTMDVDRLDYLVRDSFFCGVPYGRCGVEMLLSNLHLSVVKGKLELLLHVKAVHALEDMLWSRYQLFIQVLNHKTNVGLNASLDTAIEDAIRDDRIAIPRSYEDFLFFTDDYVMSRIMETCLRGDLKHTSYAKALVDRRLLKHVGVVQAREKPKGTRQVVSRQRNKIARKYGINAEDVMIGEARSVFIKPSTPLPMVLSWDRETGDSYTSSFRDVSSFLERIPATHHEFHFFVDRGSTLQRGSDV